jgi:hypothetical protein
MRFGIDQQQVETNRSDWLPEEESPLSPFELQELVC